MALRVRSTERGGGGGYLKTLVDGKKHCHLCFSLFKVMVTVRNLILPALSCNSTPLTIPSHHFGYRAAAAVL